MKTISHSEATAYMDCPKKWDLIYNKGVKKTSPHLDFGVIAHKVLESREIPDETLYPNLKETFNIKSWKNYFSNVISEIDKILKDYEILDKELKIKSDDGIVGVIDLVCKKDNNIYLFDYKFTNNEKDYLDIYLDEQLKLYAYLYSKKNWVNIDNIYVGYISIPKTELDEPVVLKNGKLSKNKSQCTTKDLYLQAIKEHGLDIAEYEDFLSELKSYIHIVFSKIEPKQCYDAVDNILNISKAREILPILQNATSIKCRNCEYLKECKYDC